MHSKETFHCRVCGLEHQDEPWGLDGKSPTFDICICCGVEFGYQDTTPESAARFRARWLDDGANWRDPKKKPDDWDMVAQLAQIPSKFAPDS